MLLSKFVLYYCLHYIIPRILHIISWKNWYSVQTKSWWWAIPKIHVYLILRFYSNCENLMLMKYTCFTVFVWTADCSEHKWEQFILHYRMDALLLLLSSLTLPYMCINKYSLKHTFLNRFPRLRMNSSGFFPAGISVLNCSPPSFCLYSDIFAEGRYDLSTSTYNR